jgi:ribosome-associated translation inhibitor RaiA
MSFHISNQTNRSQTMSVPVDISFQGIPHSKAVEEAVINHADRLERIRADLMRCRVSLAVGAKHQHQGKPFDVNVQVFTPHQTHVSSNTSNEDPYVALHEAFSHVERMLVEANGKRESHS